LTHEVSIWGLLRVNVDIRIENFDKWKREIISMIKEEYENSRVYDFAYGLLGLWMSL